MPEVTHDCPRCGASHVTFDCFSRQLFKVEYEWKSTFEVFSVCRRCKRSTILFMALHHHESKDEVLGSDFWKKPTSLERFFRGTGHVSLKDKETSPPPENLPPDVEAAY